MSGYFIPFLLDFSAMTNEEQADAMLAAARQALAGGHNGAAIVYSANYGQTRTICATYDRGEWHTGIAGANQARVMMALERKLGDEAADLRHHMRIAPISTMSYPHRSDPLDIVRDDLARIRKWLDNDWDVLGWQNQMTIGTDRPYAVGGGVAGGLPDEIADAVQTTLASLHRQYAPPVG